MEANFRGFWDMAKPNNERRKHSRQELPCPITLHCDGQTPCRSTAFNISNGGVFLTLPTAALPQRECEVEILFSVPRSTPNTYMLEEFTCKAKVIRHQPLADDAQAGLALQFLSPQPLMLDT